MGNQLVTSNQMPPYNSTCFTTLYVLHCGMGKMEWSGMQNRKYKKKFILLTLLGPSHFPLQKRILNVHTKLFLFSVQNSRKSNFLTKSMHQIKWFIQFNCANKYVHFSEKSLLFFLFNTLSISCGPRWSWGGALIRDLVIFWVIHKSCSWPFTECFIACQLPINNKSTAVRHYIIYILVISKWK